MTEREPKTTIFTFVCPKERIADVKKTFKEKKLGQLNTDDIDGVRLLYNPATDEILRAYGVQVVGVGFKSNRDEIIQTLFDLDIVYSESTQVIFEIDSEF